MEKTVTITIRNVPVSYQRALKRLAQKRALKHSSVEELLRREIAKLVSAKASTTLPIKLYMTPALPRHYVAERDDGSKWIILATAFGQQAWADAREFKGNYTLERLPEYMAKLYLPEE